MNLTVKLFYFFLVSFVAFNFIELFNHSQMPHEPEKANEKPSYQEQFNKAYKIYAVPLPGKLNFAGEDVPVENFDVREALDREFLVNTYWQSQTLLFIKRANRYFPIIEPILKSYNVPDDFKYLALIESGLTNVISPVGATGYWQFMKGAAKDYGLEINTEIDERYNLEKSTEAACKYILHAYKNFNSWTMAAASYNVGQRGVNKQVVRQKQEKDDFYDLLLNEETTRYVYRTLAIKYIMQEPEKYGFYYRESDLYPPLATRKVKVDSTVSHWDDFAKKFDCNYKVLKNLNPWLRQKNLINKNKKSYYVTVPLEGGRAAYKNIIQKDSLE